MQMNIFEPVHRMSFFRILAACLVGGTLFLGGQSGWAGDITPNWTDFSVVTIGGTTGSDASKAGDLSTGGDITGTPL